MVQQDDGKSEPNTTTRENLVANGDVKRRTCLRLLGTAGAVGVLPFEAGLAGGQVKSDEFRTITLSDGETRTIKLDDGETFENVLVDQRADDCHLRINTRGNVDDFTIRNVGFLGVPQGEKHVMNIAGTGTVENVFIDGRRRDGTDGTKMGGIRMKGGHSGRIEVRHTFIAGMGNNASYASSAGKNGGGNGAIIYENCYHRDNTSSNYRPGTEGSRIRNSVSIANDPDCLRGPYPHSEARGIRGAWVKHWPDQRIENCAFYMSPDDCNPNQIVEARHFEKSDGPGVEVDIVDTGVNSDAPGGFNERSEADGYAEINTSNIHQNPSVDVLQDGGIPLNPQMAARGERAMPPAIDESVPPGGMEPTDGGDGSTDTSSTLTVDGTDAGETDYVFTVSGDLAENPDVGSLGTGDAIDGNTATGFVNGGVDGYIFTGDITDAAVDGDATILVDGQAVDPDTLADPEPTIATDAASDVTAESVQLNATVGSLGEAASATVEFEWRTVGETSWNSTDTETVETTGGVSRPIAGLDPETDYEYRAALTASDGDIATGSTVTLTTAAVSQERTLTVDGTDAGETDYAFSVSGDLAENPDVGSLGTGDDIDGDTAIGFVNGGVDGYIFTGDITDATVNGDATILVNGQAVDPDTLGESSETQLPNTVTIDGSGTDRSVYTFTVDGEVAVNTAVDSGGGDQITDDGSVEGTVYGGTDSYVYSGDITSLSVDGDATLSFDDTDG